MWIASTLMLHQALAAAIASISIGGSGLTRALTMIVAEPGRASPKCFARAAAVAATSSSRASAKARPTGGLPPTPAPTSRPSVPPPRSPELLPVQLVRHAVISYDELARKRNGLGVIP